MKFKHYNLRYDKMIIIAICEDSFFREPSATESVNTAVPAILVVSHPAAMNGR